METKDTPKNRKLNIYLLLSLISFSLIRSEFCQSDPIRFLSTALSRVVRINFDEKHLQKKIKKCPFGIGAGFCYAN